MKSHVILIHGKQGSGKSTLSQNLSGLLDEVMMPHEELKFAASLYEMHAAIEKVADRYGISFQAKEGRLLQLLGTEWGRKEKGENVWVNALKHQMKEEQDKWHEPITFVIDDCRFKNEFEAFPEAFRVKLIAPEEVRQVRTKGWRMDVNHQSEIDLDQVEGWDLVLDTSTMEKWKTATTVFALAQQFFKDTENERYPNDGWSGQ